MTKHDYVLRTPVSYRRYASDWPTIVEAIGRAFRMTDEEQQRLLHKKIARLIGAIPYLAGCTHPKRTAVSHLGTYLLSIKETKPVFDADPNDDEDIFDRLWLIMNFEGGDQTIIDKGMSLLGLIMLEDYRRDQQIDTALGKYNPVQAGAFDYRSVREALIERYNAVDCPQLDAVMHMDEIELEGKWNN